MGLSTKGPITPWIGSWAWELEQKRKGTKHERNDTHDSKPQARLGDSA